MNPNDFKNSEVRTVDKSQYDANNSEYMQAYSFILSWGWKRTKTVDAGNLTLYRWISKDKKYSVETVFEAQSIQKLRILTEDLVDDS